MLNKPNEGAQLEENGVNNGGLNCKKHDMGARISNFEVQQKKVPNWKKIPNQWFNGPDCGAQLN